LVQLKPQLRCATLVFQSIYLFISYVLALRWVNMLLTLYIAINTYNPCFDNPIYKLINANFPSLLASLHRLIPLMIQKPLQRCSCGGWGQVTSP
jgi:hypothetical protein